MASGCGAANIATHFVLANSGCATPFVPTCGTPPNSVAHFRTALGVMGTVGPKPNFEVSACIICS